MVPKQNQELHSGLVCVSAGNDNDESCSVRDCMRAADVNHYKENECMRLAMEDVLYNNGVDIVLNGHCHEYERSNPVYVSCLVSEPGQVLH